MKEVSFAWSFLLNYTIKEIIAYKQPVTRQEIEKLRGVNSDRSVTVLSEYGLVEDVGRLDAPGRPLIYATTDEFLRVFGYSSLTDLPKFNLEQNLTELKIDD